MARTINGYGEGGVSDSVRIALPGNEMSDEYGGKYDVKLFTNVLAIRKEHYETLRVPDVAIFSRPHNFEYIEYLKNNGAKIIVDMDDDFHLIPEGHPGYRNVGYGNPYMIYALEQSLALADLITVTNKHLQKRLEIFEKPIRIIPNGWSSSNDLWRHKVRHSTVDFYWGGTITHRSDFKEAQYALIRTLHADRNTSFTIAGDPEIFMEHIGISISPSRKRFIPMVSYEYYPFTMARSDILLAPLERTNFNIHKSDIKLVDAGARGIPFIASYIEPYMDWRGGGMLCYSERDWISAIGKLAGDPDLREELGREGYELAQGRTMEKLVLLWEDAIESL